MELEEADEGAGEGSREALFAMDGKKWVHLINGSGWKSIAEGKDELIAERLKSWVNHGQVL